MCQVLHKFDSDTFLESQLLEHYVKLENNTSLDMKLSTWQKGITGSITAFVPGRLLSKPNPLFYLSYAYYTFVIRFYYLIFNTIGRFSGTFGGTFIFDLQCRKICFIAWMGDLMNLKFIKILKVTFYEVLPLF